MKFYPPLKVIFSYFNVCNDMVIFSSQQPRTQLVGWNFLLRNCFLMHVITIFFYTGMKYDFSTWFHSICLDQIFFKMAYFSKTPYDCKWSPEILWCYRNIWLKKLFWNNNVLNRNICQIHSIIYTQFMAAKALLKMQYPLKNKKRFTLKKATPCI